MLIVENGTFIYKCRNNTHALLLPMDLVVLLVAMSCNAAMSRKMKMKEVVLTMKILLLLLQFLSLFLSLSINFRLQCPL